MTSTGAALEFDPFSARKTLKGQTSYYDLHTLESAGVTSSLAKLPFSIRILLEAMLRTCDGFAVRQEDVKRLANWNAKKPESVELPFKPARVILQDFTGVPCLVDIAAMRSAVARLGASPTKINPLVQVDLVADHSVQVDAFGGKEALAINVGLEYKRNHERYEFLRWGQNAVRNFRVVPPGMGIVHQVNLEYLAQGVLTGKDAKGEVAMFDSLVGTDSHTTMINGLGVLGWGVGGIEAEAVMLGQPLYMVTPQVIGVKLHGRLKPGVTATDLVLTVTQLLRKKGVVDKFVEFYGEALSTLALADRATIANMAPEYGATCGFFPTDAVTVEYLRRTGRTAAADLVSMYAKAQGLFRDDTSPEPEFTDTVDFDLSSVEPSLAGPKRPQDRVPLKDMKSAFQHALTASVKDGGFAVKDADVGKTSPVKGSKDAIGHGSVVIAAITSCTNTSNPSVMIAAGLLAKKAAAKGLQSKSWVKTSIAPGSKVVTEYLRESGLLPELEKLNFYVVGYGCTTCIGNSGPLPEAVVQAIDDGNLVAAAVLSGNRNFEGRISPNIKANYLASPPLVVAYALAGTTQIDWDKDPIGMGSDGKPVMLADIWPSAEEIQKTLESVITPAMFEKSYADVFTGPDEWKKISGVSGDLFAWKSDSTYVQEPPFFIDFGKHAVPVTDIRDARVLAVLGDSVTTDHISPAGDIAEDSPAGKFLKQNGVSKIDFNSYGSRRGNDRVMVRGTFANIRLKNQMVPGVEGGVTVHLPSGTQMCIYDAAMKYKEAKIPQLVLAGKEYGTGSSRDWAAKGPMLLGVRAVIAESFERIHRANLVGMGVLPLVFKNDQGVSSLGLTGKETFTIEHLATLKPRQDVVVKAKAEDGSEKTFTVTARLDTPIDVMYYNNGGILQTVLRQLLAT